MTPPTASIQSILQKHKKRSDKIDGIFLEMELLKGQVLLIKDNLAEQIAKDLQRLPFKDIHSTLSKLYWISKELAWIVRTARKLIALPGPFYPSPQEFEFPCQSCRTPSIIQVKSWKEYEDVWPYTPSGKSKKNHWKKPLCDSCKIENVESERRKDKEYHEHRKQQSEYLECLRTMPYKDYLQTDHWKQTRLKSLRRSNFRCQLCNKEGRLNVHHRTYENLGWEFPSDLITLCEACHAKHHDVIPESPK